MTICIAAPCIQDNDESAILLCSDRLLSGALGGSETMLKQRILPNKSIFMPSGGEDDILALLRLLRRGTNWEADRMSEDDALSYVRKALAMRKKEKADEYTLGKFAVNYDDFLATGKTRFPDDIFRATISNIGLLDIGVDAIVAGFSDAGFPFLIETSSDGSAKIREGYAAVGSGSYLAHASLSHRGVNEVARIHECLYAVYEAKKYAERVGSVGKSTTLTILPKEGKWAMITPTIFAELDALYAELGPKRIPDDVRLDIGRDHPI